jgi:hypothetical protein
LFDEDIISSSLFLDMLENYGLPQLNRNSNLIHQLEVAPVHFAHIVPDCLNMNFACRWIGRGPIAWPSRSFDLTPVDFLLLDCVKHQVYSHRVNMLDELKAQLTVANADVTKDIGGL